MPRHLAILSPHLDDAALSCADHILMWRRRGWKVTVFTIFTSFPDGAVCEFVQPYMTAAGFGSAGDYEKSRKEEDLAAMQLLNVDWKHLDFADAGFRGRGDVPDYHSYKQLCPGEITATESPHVERLVENLQATGPFDLVLTPLGVGGHVDHLIVKEAAQRCFPADRLRYYAEFPYARNPLKWNLRQLGGLLSACSSVKWISRAKLNVLGCYVSQIRYLFSGRPRYPEIVLTGARL